MINSSWIAWGAVLLCTVFLGGLAMGGGNAETPSAQSLDTDTMSEPELSTDDGVTECFDTDEGDAGDDGGDTESSATLEENAGLPAAAVHEPKAPEVPLAFAGFLDPGSAATWGASAGFEVGRKSSFVLSLRVPNAGHFPYKAAGEDSDFRWGFGVSVGPRRYFRKEEPLRGVYFGGSVEYFMVAGRRDVYDWRYAYLGPALQVGYRFMFGRFLLSLGGRFGALFNLSRKRIYDFGWEQSLDRGAPLPLTELMLEVGWKGERQ